MALLQRMDYSGGAVITALTSTINGAAMSCSIDSATNWPVGGVNGPFMLTLDPGLASEERIRVASRSGTTLTFAARGVDDTVATDHASGAVAQHTFSAIEADDSNRHIYTTGDDDHTQYMRADGTRHDTTTRHSAGTVVPTAVPVATGTALAEGGGTQLARASHVHTIGVGSINNVNNFAADVVNQAALAPLSVGTPELIDSSVTNAKLAGGITENKLTPGLYVPIGGIVMWPDDSIPSNWMFCQGQAISRTTYATLFGMIGTTYGVGDGSTTFGLPDMRQRFPLGVAASGTGATLGGVGGNVDHVHGLDTSSSHARITVSSTSPHIRADRKTIVDWNRNFDVTASAGGGSVALENSGVSLGGTSDTNNPPYRALHFIIRVL